MLDQLLETKQGAQRKPLGTFVSVALHVMVIGAAAYLTQKAAIASEPTPQVLVRVPIQQREPAPVRHQPATTSDPQMPARFGHQELTLPTTPSLDIPSVDLSAPPTDTRDWTGEGPSGGRGTGVPGGAASTTDDAPCRDFQVNRPAASIPGTAPSYPEMLKSSGVEGEAQVQFVVDTLGRAELASFKVLASSHAAFGDAVRSALPRMRFLPAEANGRKVRMVVQQKFAFALNR